MSFQAYLDTIEAKTGKTPADFKTLAREAGLTAYHDLFVWLKTEHGLGHGHANAMAHVILGTFEQSSPSDEVDGDVLGWLRQAYDRAG